MAEERDMEAAAYRSPADFDRFSQPPHSPRWSPIKPLQQVLEQERSRWFLWLPACFGLGIGVYFALGFEPGWLATSAIVLAGLSVYLFFRYWIVGYVFATTIFVAALGFADAKLRTELVRAPVLEKQTGPVEVVGWVERIEPRPKGKRITLRVIRIGRGLQKRSPHRVRVVVKSPTKHLQTGQALSMRAVLLPPPEPTRPGGFDFARQAWFLSLGAVGYAVSKPVQTQPKTGPPVLLRVRVIIHNLRNAVSKRIAEKLPQVQAALTEALITGERGGIDEETLLALRHSGLAHILAISGLHMAMMAGAIYWLVRSLLAAWPWVTLRLPIKKLAALLALLGGAFYLLLSGSAIATQRAFVMISIIFLAIILNRQGLTLRNVALAALAILIPRPESLFDVGFQMSFAAATSLVAVYEWVQQNKASYNVKTFWPRFLHIGWRYIAGIAVTTLIAGLVVSPYAAFHFHKFTQYGLAANIAAMPVFGLLVMPMALLTLMAMPFGLESIPLQVMAFGINLVIQIAETVSSWPGSVYHTQAFPGISLALITIGGLWIGLWQVRWRFLGLIIIASGLISIAMQSSPDVYIEREAKTFAVRAPSGLLSAPSLRAGKYSLKKWLEADGDARPVEEVTKGEGFRCDEAGCVTAVKGRTVTFIRHPSAFAEDCQRADLVISQIPYSDVCTKAKLVIDRHVLRMQGAHAVYLENGKLRVETVTEHRGKRPWVRSSGER